MDQSKHLQTLAALPAWWWGLLVACVAGFVLLRAAVRERPRAARECELRALIDGCGRAKSRDEQARLDALRSPSRHTSRRLPRFLFLGDSAAHSAGMEDAAFWKWTEMPALTAIVVHPEVVEAPDAPATRRAWAHALLTLAQANSRLPLNGIVVQVDVRRLQAPDAVIASVGSRLRRCIDDAASRLHLRLPTYVLVTGLDALEGFDVVRKALPAAVHLQSVGHRIDDRRTTAAEVIETVFARLHALRMALLSAHPGAADRLAIHRFIESLREAERGLHVLAKALFEASPDAADGTAAQPCRGLYLIANGTAGQTFTDDLFARFLPADQPLARAM